LKVELSLLNNTEEGLENEHRKNSAFTLSKGFASPGFWKTRTDNNAGGFPKYIQQAKELGMDVNDYKEQGLFGNPRSILEEFVYPYLKGKR
jgi:hypothetical protein